MPLCSSKQPSAHAQPTLQDGTEACTIFNDGSYAERRVWYGNALSAICTMYSVPGQESFGAARHLVRLTR
jgi:hypothetical protein